MPVGDASFDIWGGGEGVGKKWFVASKVRKKKFVENVGRKKKFVVEIDEKYVDQKKTTNGNVHNMESIGQKKSSTKHRKKLSNFARQKKRFFPLGGK